MNAERPREEDTAIGNFPTTPIRMVSTPEISEVAAATAARFGASPPPRKLPIESVEVPMISGFSTMM